jgi:hypothetical protein
MIVFLLANAKVPSIDAVIAAARDRDIAKLAYAELFAAPRLPRATYIFGNLDMLSWSGLRSAAAAYRQLRAQGVRVLNDPARVASRFGLLRQLYLAGMNQFNAYRAEEGVRPQRWPVFLRIEASHGGPISQLLNRWEEVRGAIAEAVAAGIPLTTILIVEYAGQPVRPGLFRRLAIYRIGDRSVADTCVHERDWRAKEGEDGIATPELYEDELRIVRDNPYRDVVGKAFDLAGIDYGRADFGLVDGRVQVYEINPTPFVELLGDGPSPLRSESNRLSNAHYLDALRQLDSPAGPFLKPFDPKLVPKPSR